MTDLITDCGEPPDCRQCAWNAGTLAVMARREARVMIHYAYVSRLDVYYQLRRMLEQINGQLWSPEKAMAELTGPDIPDEAPSYWQLAGPKPSVQNGYVPTAPTGNAIKRLIDRLIPHG